VEGEGAKGGGRLWIGWGWFEGWRVRESVTPPPPSSPCLALPYQPPTPRSHATYQSHTLNRTKPNQNKAPRQPQPPQLVVTARDWPLREKFLAALRASLNAISQRAPWYPGSEAKCKAFLAKFPNVSALIAGGLVWVGWVGLGGRVKGRVCLGWYEEL